MSTDREKVSERVKKEAEERANWTPSDELKTEVNDGLPSWSDTARKSLDALETALYLRSRVDEARKKADKLYDELVEAANLQLAYTLLTPFDERKRLRAETFRILSERIGSESKPCTFCNERH